MDKMKQVYLQAEEGVNLVSLGGNRSKRLGYPEAVESSTYSTPLTSSRISHSKLTGVSSTTPAALATFNMGLEVAINGIAGHPVWIRNECCLCDVMIIDDWLSQGCLSARDA